MRLFSATLMIFLLTGCVRHIPSRQPPREQSTHIRKVRGVLAFNFEYSYFSDQSAIPERTFEFEVRDARWSKLHADVLLADPRKGIEYRCISGSGYENRVKLGPTGRSTFVFTNVREVHRVNSERDCL